MVKALDIKGRKYVQVADRISEFRKEHRNGSIVTELLFIEDDSALFKATVLNSEGFLLGTGHARCTKAMAKQAAGRFVEKAETSAIGRAMSAAGYGTSALLEDEDENYISDTPRESTSNHNRPDGMTQAKFIQLAEKPIGQDGLGYKSGLHVMNALRRNPEFTGNSIQEFPGGYEGAWRWLADRPDKERSE